MKRYLLVFLFPLLGLASPQGVPGTITFTCGLTSLQMVPQNNNRSYLIMQNQGSDTTGHCHLKAGSTITGTEGLWVDHGQNFETVEAYTKQPWWCKCDSAAQTFEVLYTNW